MKDLSAFVTQPSALLQNMNLENEMGTFNKPQKLFKMEDNPSWADKFEIHVQATNYDTLLAVEEECIIQKNDNSTNYRLSQIQDDKATLLSEKKMLNIFQQMIKAEIFKFCQHNESCYSIWKSLLNKDTCNPDKRKLKMA